MNVDQDRDIVDALPRLIDKIGDVTGISLFVLNASPESNRVVDEPELKLVVAEALHVRKEYKVPFWEAVLLIARRDNAQALNLILDAAIHHQPMSDAVEKINLPTGGQFPHKLRDIVDGVDERHIIVLSSRVMTRNPQSPAHLQMLDFRIRPSEENERLAADILKRVGAEGILLNSGNSYHFYGYGLMPSDAELSGFLGRASLFAPFVDQRWIAHQMIEGACALRISRGKSFARSPIFACYISGA